MFSPLRRVGVIAARRSTRSVTTIPNEPSSVMKEAMGALAGILGQKDAFNQPLAPPPTPPSLPATLANGPQDQPLMLIPVEEDPLLQFLTSYIQRNGERKKAAKIVSRTLLFIHTLTRSPPLPILREAVLQVAPACKITSTMFGVRPIYKPVALSEKQRTHYAIKWILESSKSRPEHKLEERLAREVVDIVQCTDPKSQGALKKKMEVYNMAMKNR